MIWSAFLTCVYFALSYVCSNKVLFLYENKCVIVTVIHTKTIATTMSQSCLLLSQQFAHLIHIFDVETREGTHRLRTSPTFPNYTQPSPDTNHRLPLTLAKHHMLPTPQLYISTKLDKIKLSEIFFLPLYRCLEQTLRPACKSTPVQHHLNLKSQPLQHSRCNMVQSCLMYYPFYWHLPLPSSLLCS